MFADLKLIIFFIPVVANSDFPANQVSVQHHSEHFKIRHRIHYLLV